jgi:hypothetical protein
VVYLTVLVTVIVAVLVGFFAYTLYELGDVKDRLNALESPWDAAKEEDEVVAPSVAENVPAFATGPHCVKCGRLILHTDQAAQVEMNIPLIGKEIPVTLFICQEDIASV